MTWAVVPAAGRGTRFGAETPKQYLMLAGRPVIEHSDAVDDGSEIGQVAVIHACVDTVLGDGIGLPLERAACVDHQLNVQRAQNVGECRGHRITAPALARTAGQGFELVDLALQLEGVTARDHQVDALHHHQMLTDDTAKIPVPADHQYP